MVLVRNAGVLDQHVSLSPPLSDLQCAIGIRQLARYDSFLARRREIAARYDSAISSKDSTFKRMQTGEGDLFRYVLTSKRTYDDVAQIFNQSGIHIRRGVDALLHRQDGLSDDNFPVATQLIEQTVSVPFYPSLQDCQVDRVVQVLERITT